MTDRLRFKVSRVTGTNEPCSNTPRNAIIFQEASAIDFPPTSTVIPVNIHHELFSILSLNEKIIRCLHDLSLPLNELPHSLLQGIVISFT